ncbi:type II toxin-antitoxin system HicA family toxin [Ursidibacter maritimus]|uniref:Type II toxin-antitoxin system HicA family toxin n=1 Tax=Ursidibacter maritimus TaxID=1331689 RepID=A0A949WF23_9PAST|nr:type II toxin-antitoxin system HicA family toxin [Ursidibacter maritimus]KAE9541421.1 hypothetical protein A1D26_00480 [Ursidibacter maritimus]MBV6523852.1 type II toxin-antitoxin system HicA family toxin [Ursidibacter maritimus]MBV6526127.1 type II toxin-antitoxin system HicA family toxin [Ursidibacter maritimus]MBV6527167.1 type II toxin-antitoxin system HicA family toxin [Ursidibacter maritimus]MBV6528998.1 type II toxin-antitoxin system HicA family toxin [Ursidibacter maritimus]
MVSKHLNKKHQRTLIQIYQHPISANIKWESIENLFLALGAEIYQREGSRIAVILFEQVRVFHRPHPEPTTDKGAIATIRKWFSENGVYPYA